MLIGVAGVVKALVVTSVAEEGLDVSACNLIIKYNVVGSERTLIQRRGRARALDSRSILLALDGSVERREVENIHRERVMHACLRNLQVHFSFFHCNHSRSFRPKASSNSRR